VSRALAILALGLSVVATACAAKAPAPIVSAHHSLACSIAAAWVAPICASSSCAWPSQRGAGAG